MGSCQHSWRCPRVSSYGAHGFGVVCHDKHLLVPFLFSQKATKSNIAAALVAVLGVFSVQVRRFVGPAILVGALAGVAAGMIVSRKEGAHVVE